MAGFLQSLINGLLIGGVYSLVAVGLNLIYGVMDVVNFAHGATVMVAMFLTYWFSTLLRIDPLLSLPLVGVSMFILGYLTQAILIDRTLKGPMIAQLGATFGLMIFLENLALLLWGSDWRSLNPPYGTVAFHLGDLSISFTRLLASVIALLMIGVLYLILARTKLGLAIRATAQNREAAAIVGINITNIYRITFGLGLAFTGIAGGLLMTFYYVYPSVGFTFGLTAFVVCVLGGLGNLEGATLGGLIIGLTQTMGGYYIGPQYKYALSFIIFMLVLAFMPEGLQVLFRGKSS